MSLTITKVPDAFDVWGRTYVDVRDLTLDDSYPSTGYVLNAGDFGMKYILGVEVIGGNQAAGKLQFVADFNGSPGDVKTQARLRAFFPTGGAGTAPSTLANAVGTLSSPTITMGGTATGTLTAGSDTVDIASNVSVPATGLTATIGSSAAALTPGVAVEVATGADLSTIQLRVRVTGR